MAALSLHTTCLLVLLAMLSPGSQATAVPYLCGSDLIDALQFVCGERGFSFKPRGMQVPAGNPVRVSGEQQATGVATQEQMESRVGRSVQPDCCYRPCSLSDLVPFCN